MERLVLQRTQKHFQEGNTDSVDRQEAPQLQREQVNEQQASVRGGPGASQTPRSGGASNRRNFPEFGGWGAGGAGQGELRVPGSERRPLSSRDSPAGQACPRHSRPGDPSPDTVTLAIRVSTYECGATAQPVAGRGRMWPGTPQQSWSLSRCSPGEPGREGPACSCGEFQKSRTGRSREVVTNKCLGVFQNPGESCLRTRKTSPSQNVKERSALAHAPCSRRKPLESCHRRGRKQPTPGDPAVPPSRF